MQDFNSHDWAGFAGAEPLPDGSAPQTGESNVGGQEVILILSGDYDDASRKEGCSIDVMFPLRPNEFGGADELEDWVLKLPGATTAFAKHVASSLEAFTFESREQLASFGFVRR